MTKHPNPAPSDTPPTRGRGLSLPSPSRQRAKKTNSPLAAHELKTARGRRVADLAGAFAEALGNPSDITRQAAIVAAAELAVLAEEARALALANPGSVDLDQIVRVQGAADRAVRRLGIKPGAVADKTPTIYEIAARHRKGSAGAQ